ncbi:hypothetical protein [Nocardia sp. NPDC058705]|uniref:hypothetical protein n=1 Tax=Nocardia sp. NPDC058705 TaxID=3346609 RepID=UPI00367AB07E
MIASGVDYRPWEGQRLDDDQCFICGAELDPSTYTKEDVIPRWMQREIAKRKHSRPFMELPNETAIALGKILVPACRTCNNAHLSGQEKSISGAFKKGPFEVRKLPEQTLRIWFAKIAYGLRRNDLRLKRDRSDPASLTVAARGDVEQLAHLHLLLQEVRDVVYIPDPHSTFFVFEAQEADCGACDFDAAFPIGWPYPVMLRLGNTVVMGAVDDRRLLTVLRSHSAFKAAAKLKLHPIQVRALWAILLHTATMLNPSSATLRFGVTGNRLLVRSELGGGPVLDMTRSKVSVDKVLQNLIGMPEDELAAQGGAVGLLVDKNGDPREMVFEHNA